MLRLFWSAWTRRTGSRCRAWWAAAGSASGARCRTALTNTWPCSPRGPASYRRRTRSGSRYGDISRTHRLTHSNTHPSARSLPPSLAHSLTRSLTPPSHTHSLSLTHSLTPPSHTHSLSHSGHLHTWCPSTKWCSGQTLGTQDNYTLFSARVQGVDLSVPEFWDGSVPSDNRVRALCSGIKCEHGLIHSLTGSLTHWLIWSLSHSLIHPHKLDSCKSDHDFLLPTEYRTTHAPASIRELEGKLLVTALPTPQSLCDVMHCDVNTDHLSH